MNFFTIVGRLKGNIVEQENGFIMNIKVKRLTNQEDEELFDVFEIINKGLNPAKEYMTDGSLVGVKGRLQNEDGKVILIAEKLTFMSQNKENVEEK